MSNLNLSAEETQKYIELLHDIDPTGTTHVPIPVATEFFRRSGLPVEYLRKVWEFSAPKEGNFFTRPSLMAALKLIALAQSGQELNLTTLANNKAPLPVLLPVGGVSSTPVTSTSSPATLTSGSGWDITPVEKSNYDITFNAHHPEGGKLSGEKAKGVSVYIYIYIYEREEREEKKKRSKYFKKINKQTKSCF